MGEQKRKTPFVPRDRETKMLTKNHDILTLEVKKHIEADAVVQGGYWNGSRGCFIGCLAHSSDALALQDKFGLPLPLVRLCERVFEDLSENEAKAFFAAFPAAVGRDGKDLSRVHWGVLGSELRALPGVPSKAQSAIDAVIVGMDKLSKGEEWSSEDAHTASDAASTAARTSSYAAARAAYAAAARTAASTAASTSYAAYAAADAADRTAYAAAYDTATRRQRDTILKLIKEA
jgi:hypothetical protein